MLRTRIFVIGVILLSFSFALNVLAYSDTSSSEQSTGKIKGLILDINNARIANARVMIESSPNLGFREQLKSGEAGDFEIEVPTGTYYLSIEANGFCRFEGWELKVNPKVTEMVNIHLAVAIHTECRRCSLGPHKENVERPRPPVEKRNPFW